MTIFINPVNTGSKPAILRVTVRLGESDVIAVDAIAVFGCLALHESVTTNDLTITHIQSGHMVIKLSRNTPIEAMIYQINQISSVMESVFDPNELSPDDQQKVRKLQSALAAIDAVYR